MNQPVESEMLILERIFKVVDEFGVAGQYKDEELWLDTTEGNRQIFERKPGAWLKVFDAVAFQEPILYNPGPWVAKLAELYRRAWTPEERE